MPRTAFDYEGRPIVVTRAGQMWHVQVGDGQPVGSRYLDVALAVALPTLRRRELDLLLVRLLDWSLSQGRHGDTTQAGA